MTEATKVTMSDQTVLEFSAKDKVKKLSSITDEGIEVKFAFRTGNFKTCFIPFGAAVLMQAALHGFNQKFGDSFAGVDDVEDCEKTFDKLAESIGKDEWTQARVSDGMAGTSELARALVKITGNTKDAVEAQLKKLSKDEKAALRLQPPVLAAIAEIKAAKKPKEGAADGAAVLAGFKPAATATTEETADAE